MSKLQEKIENLLAPADIKINGDRPWDIQIHNEALYRRVLLHGSIGFGEAYMDGWWDCKEIDEMIRRVFAIDILKHIKPWNAVGTLLLMLTSNRQSKQRAFQVGEEHYDAGNDLYERMLDKNMTYTCGYWKDTNNLDDAQIAKYELACKKIGLKTGDTVLDIGCGWGSFAKFATERCGAKVVGLTVSKEQVVLGKKRCAGLDVVFHLQDYRDFDASTVLGAGKKFDHIVSFGMFEHVGYKNYRVYMEMVHKNLKDDGLFLLHTIGGNKTVYSGDPWMDKYIFKNGMIPSVAQIGKSVEKLFVMEDWHNFGADYDKILMAWHTNFVSHWDEIKDQYNDRFKRMWDFYLLSCAGSFRSRYIQLWQVVLSKHGVKGGYGRVT